MTDGDDGGGGGEEDELKEIKVMDGMLSGYFSPGERCGDGEDYGATRSRWRGPKAADWHVSLIFLCKGSANGRQISQSVWVRQHVCDIVGDEFYMNPPPQQQQQQQRFAHRQVCRRQGVLLDGSVLGAFPSKLKSCDWSVSGRSVTMEAALRDQPVNYRKSPAKRPLPLFFTSFLCKSYAEISEFQTLQDIILFKKVKINPWRRLKKGNTKIFRY